MGDRSDNPGFGRPLFEVQELSALQCTPQIAGALFGEFNFGGC